MNHSRLLTATFASLCLSLPVVPASAQQADSAAIEEIAPNSATDSAAEAMEAAAEAAVEAMAEVSEPVSSDDGAGFDCANPSAAQWLGQGRDAVNLGTADTPFQERVSSTERQMRAFHLSEAQSLRIEAKTHNDGDPALEILDSSGAQIAANDDLPRSLNAGIQLDLPQGDYCVVMTDRSAQMDVTLQVARQDQPALIESAELSCGPDREAADLTDGPLELALAKGPITSQGTGEGSRYLRFEIATPTSLSLLATGSAQMDPYMALFDASGQQIAMNDDADGNNPRLDFMPTLAAGRYCIGLGTMNDQKGAITLIARPLDPADYLRRSYERGELPPPEGDYPVTPLNFARHHTEVVLQGSSASWFSFELKERSVVAIHTLGAVTGADTRLVLFDGDGAVVADVDDSESGRDSRISPTVLREGKYRLALLDVAASGQLGAPLRPVVIMAEKFVQAE